MTKKFGESVLVYNLDSITAVQYVIPVPNLKSNCLSDKDVLEVCNSGHFLQLLSKQMTQVAKNTLLVKCMIDKINLNIDGRSSTMM